MIRGLLEQAYLHLPASPHSDQIEPFLRGLRTPELLRERVKRYPEHAAG